MTIRTPADAPRPWTGQRTRSPGDGYPLPPSANFHATPGASRRRGAAEDPYLACRIRLRSGQQKSPTGVRGDSRTGVSVTVLQLDECGAARNKLTVWDRPLNRRRVASAASPSACPAVPRRADSQNDRFLQEAAPPGPGGLSKDREVRTTALGRLAILCTPQRQTGHRQQALHL
jgi:hypothetical protein